MDESIRRCTIEGCGRPQKNKKRGLCNTHYLRWIRHGDVHYDESVKIARFWKKVQKGDNCWEWQGNKLLLSGYGVIQRDGKRMYAHRVSYEIEHGNLPDSLVIDHLCRNRGCVRPSHLEAVTFTENVLRGDGPTAKNARKTHCKRNHPLSGENLYVNPQGFRQCRTCMRMRKNGTINDAQ
jgi:hypothetical protein